MIIIRIFPQCLKISCVSTTLKIFYDANDCNSTNTLNSSVDEIKLDSNASKTIHKNNCGLYIHVHDIYANQTEDIEIKCDPHYKGDIKIQKNHL